MKTTVWLLAICLGVAACNNPAPQPVIPPVAPTAGTLPAIDTSGSFAKGFDYTEAATLLELCTNINNPGEYPYDTTGWTPVWPATDVVVADIGPWQNAWKLWKKTGEPNTYAIVIRGTISKQPSIVEDVIATSIAAHAVIKAWPDGYLSMTLADVPEAETHLGFTYALAILMFANDHGILQQLKASVPKGAKLYITGHSQGAAVATLVHAFLHYAINDPTDRYGLRDSGYSLKSYFFAQPKPGNWQFAMDFARIAGSRGTSFVINNNRDWVPQVPLTLEFLDEPGADLVAQLAKGGHGATILLAELPAFAQAQRALVAAHAEADTVRDVQKFNTPSSRMDTTYRIQGPAPLVVPAESIDYVSAGYPVPVFGEAPGSPGVTPGDWLYQHHLPTYRGLMQAQLKPGGAAP